MQFSKERITVQLFSSATVGRCHDGKNSDEDIDGVHVNTNRPIRGQSSNKINK